MGLPAPFWRRYAAYSLDLTIVFLLALPLLAWELRDLPTAFGSGITALQMRILELFDASLTAPTDPFELARRWSTDSVLVEGMTALVALVTRSLLVTTAILVTVAALWFIGFETSARQATPGKRLLGLRVTDIDGHRPPFNRVALRFVAGAPSWALLHLGHAVAAWRTDRRALHDLIAGTRVELLEGNDAALPAWARAWLQLQVLGFLVGTGWIVVRYSQFLAAAAGSY